MPLPSLKLPHNLYRGALVGIFLASALFEPSVAGAAEGSTPDPGAKAEMVCNLARFVRWPDALLARTQGQIVFSIFGEDALAEALAATLSTKTIGGREVFVRFIRRAQDAAGSQVVFVASSEMQHLPELLSALAGSPCLTVADDGTFLDRGGMLQFANGEQRERFEINVGRAERAGLKLSSKLLAIARVVE